MDAAPASSADASTAGGASADASEAADVASADGPKAADAAHEGGGGGSEVPAPPPPPPPHIPPPPPPPPVPTAAVKIKAKAMPRPRPAHPKGQPPPKHVDVVTVDDESCSSPSSSWKTPAAMVQHDADGSWQTWQHGDASDGQTAWHADGANWHASMSQTVESDGWSAILGCILCIFKSLPLYIFYTAVI